MSKEMSVEIDRLLPMTDEQLLVEVGLADFKARFEADLLTSLKPILPNFTLDQLASVAPLLVCVHIPAKRLVEVYYGTDAEIPGSNIYLFSCCDEGMFWIDEHGKLNAKLA